VSVSCSIIEPHGGLDPVATIAASDMLWVHCQRLFVGALRRIARRSRASFGDGVSGLVKHCEVDAGPANGLGWGGVFDTLTDSVLDDEMPSTNSTTLLAPQPFVAVAGNIIGLQICMASLEVSGNHVLIISTSAPQISGTVECVVSHVLSSVFRVQLSSPYQRSALSV